MVVPWRRRPLSLIHVDDLVRALVLAGESDVGGVFPLEGPDRTDTVHLMRMLGAAMGRRARVLRLPLPLVWPVAAAADLVARLRRRPGLFGRDKLRDVAAPGWVVDPEPAREQLGFEGWVPSARGLRVTALEEGLAVVRHPR